MLNYTLQVNVAEFEREAKKKIEDIGSAVIVASFLMKERARQHMKTSQYRLAEVSRGIMVGTLKKARGKREDPSVKLHAFGTGEHANLARIFVGGTVYRFNRKGKGLGYVRPDNSIDEALSEEILRQQIERVIK